MRFCCLDWLSLILLVCFILLGLACRVGAMGSIYLLCLTCRLRRLTIWSLIFLGGFILFSNYRVCVDSSGSFLKKNQSTSRRPSEHPPVRGGEMSKRLGGIKGCKYKTSSWHLDRFPDADNNGSTV